jgi:DNA-binding NarL/FixJ family response regulator
VIDGASLRVVVVDDHPVVRAGLRSMLTCDGIALVGEAASGQDGLRLAQAQNPDVVLLDMQLPDISGVEVLREIKRTAAHIAVLVLSMHDDPALVRRAMEAGAAGYVLKGVTRRDLLGKLRAVAGVAGAADASPAGEPSEFTRIERRVLALMAAGRTNGEVAEDMRWSIATAKRYVQRIMEKLEATDRTQAVASALRLGLID